MVTAKKDRSRPKRERKKPADWSDDDEPWSDESEEEVVESVHARRKKEKSRVAFMKLVRFLLSFLPLAMVLSQQPFMMKPRVPGVNRLKLVPLQLAVCGAVQFAATSPTVLRNPKLDVYLNTTARVLLAPHEYARAQSSKRAMPAEKTLAGAYKKSEKALGRVADGDASLKDIATMPQPNLPLVGAALLVVGSLLAPLAAGFEYLVVIGCGLVLQGCRSFGMEPQPELYVTGAIAVLGIVAMDASKKRDVGAPTKKKRK